MTVFFPKTSTLLPLFADQKCNPSFTQILSGGSSVNGTGDMSLDNGVSVDYKSIISLVIFLVCVLYARYEYESTAVCVKAIQLDLTRGRARNVVCDDSELKCLSYH